MFQVPQIASLTVASNSFRALNDFMRFDADFCGFRHLLLRASGVAGFGAVTDGFGRWHVKVASLLESSMPR